jgi:hypothetical protein
VEIVITWDAANNSSRDSNRACGYADYVMMPNTPYTVQLARGSDVALGISAPTCQNQSGETFLGGIKLTFQQP